MHNKLLDTLKERPLLGDGAMRTQLQDAGLESGGCGEAWNLDDVDPLAIENIHIQEVIKVKSGQSLGVGVLEQLVVGPYARYGFEKFLDGAI